MTKTCPRCGKKMNLIDNEVYLCGYCGYEPGKLHCPFCGVRMDCDRWDECGEMSCPNCHYQSSNPRCPHCGRAMLRDGSDWRCQSCLDWPGKTEAVARTKEMLSKFDKVTGVSFTLDEKKKERPESMKDTLTSVQDAFIKELIENKNPYYVGDFLGRLALAIALPANITEGKFTGKGNYFEYAEFKFKMTGEGKKALNKFRSEDDEA